MRDMDLRQKEKIEDGEERRAKLMGKKGRNECKKMSYC